jgi:hypothetical protein
MTAAMEQGCAEGECISVSSRHGDPMPRDWYLGIGFPDLGSSLFSGLLTSLFSISPTPPQGRLRQLTECDPGFNECPRHHPRHPRRHPRHQVCRSGPIREGRPFCCAQRAGYGADGLSELLMAAR